MIEEAYVSYEVAKLLKEKGFNEPCYGVYYEFKTTTEFELLTNPITYQRTNADNVYYAPTQALVMRWLRETHGLYFEFTPYVKEHNVMYDYVVLKQVYAHPILFDGELEVKYNEDSKEHTYEEACEAAIKYCLENLI